MKTSRPLARTGNRRWHPAHMVARVSAGLICAAVAACTTQPARLGSSPGDYEAFVREVMAEAAKAPEAAPDSAARAVQSAARLLGKRAPEDNQGN